MSHDRDFVTSRFGVDHATQVDRRATDDRCRAPGALSCCSGIWDTGCPDAATLDHRSRAKRWRDAVAELITLQGHYAAWLEALPENLQDSATAEALAAIRKGSLVDVDAGPFCVTIDISALAIGQDKSQ